jgi:hypothetical protein
MLWHHIFGVGSIMLGNVGGYAQCGIITMLLLVEVSTVFLNYRSMYNKNEIGQAIPQLLQLLFFIFYTVFRMMLMPYGIFLLYKNYSLVFGHLTPLRTLCAYIAIAQFILLYIMNVYWYILILRGIGKMLGIIPGSKDMFEKVKSSDKSKRDVSE